MKSTVLYVGIDVGKYTHAVAIMDARKRLASAVFSIEESAAGYQELWRRLQQEQQRSNCTEIHIGMEATGDYWKNLYYFLLRNTASSPAAVRVCVINPLRTKAFTQTELRRARTDATSARDIGLFMVEKSPPPYQYLDPTLLIVKDLYSQIFRLKRQTAALKNRLRIELIKVAPELEKAMASPASQQMMALLARFPTARDIQNASIQQLRNIRYGKRNWPLPLSFVKQVKMLSQHSIAFQQEPGAGWVVQSLIRHLQHLNSEVHRLQEQMKQCYQHISNHRYYQSSIQLLTSIPGIGELSAMVLAAHIGDVRRFGNAKKMFAYFGMNPTIHSSGKSIKHASRLQKKGSPIIRHLLFLAVLNNIRQHKHPIYEYYQRLRNRGKAKLVAIGAAMRKLLAIIYGVLKNRTPFQDIKST